MLLVKEYYSSVNSFYIVEKYASFFYSKVINVVRWKSNMYLDHTSDKDLL